MQVIKAMGITAASLNFIKVKASGGKPSNLLKLIVNKNVVMLLKRYQLYTYNR